MVFSLNLLRSNLFLSRNFDSSFDEFESTVLVFSEVDEGKPPGFERCRIVSFVGSVFVILGVSSTRRKDLNEERKGTI